VSQTSSISPDSVRAVLREIFSQPSYAWNEIRDPVDLIRRWWNALLDWLAQLEAGYPGALRTLVWVLVVVLALIALHAVWLMVRMTRRPSYQSAGGTVETGPGVRDAAWFSAEADRLSRAGRFSAAMQADFVRLLLELDSRRLLQFHPSKTPREYVPELSVPVEARASFGSLVADLYRYAFAGAPCGPSEFAEWRRRADPHRYATPS
jgi:hypothetical protein